jgi:hypothetical protein
MATYNIDCEMLINEVQKRSLLWNTADENYKDKTKKNTAWSEIALSFINDFQEKNESEQKVICKYFLFFDYVIKINTI